MWINDIIDRIKLPFRKEKELFSALYDILGFYPHDIELYKQALLHKSVGKRNEKGRPQNNERLEFLGDAILDASRVSVRVFSPIRVRSWSVVLHLERFRRRWVFPS